MSPATRPEPGLWPVRLDAAEADAIGRLGEVLVARGYGALHLHVGHGRTFAEDPAGAAGAIAALGAPERHLLELFALGTEVPRAGLDPELAALVEALLRAGLARAGAGTVATAGFVVVPALAGLLMVGVPSTYRAGAELAAPGYLGNDSLVLAGLLGRTAGKRVLDLGAGCGVQGLLAARGASEAVLTDVDTESLRLSGLNAVLNAVEHRVLLGHGDLFEPVAGERFDLICVLPPYVPVPGGAGVSRTAAGGPDGLAFVRRLLSGAEAVLHPGGELVALAQLLCDGDGPLVCRELDALAPGLSVELVCVDHHRLQPYCLELAGRLAHTGRPLRPTLAALEARLRGLGATSVATTAIRARRGTAGAASGWRVIGTGAALSAGDAVRLVEGAALSRPDGAARLSVPGGPSTYLEPVTAALVGALGTGSVGDAARAAWGRPPGATLDQLDDQALSRLAPLLEMGLLERRSRAAVART